MYIYTYLQSVVTICKHSHPFRFQEVSVIFSWWLASDAGNRGPYKNAASRTVPAPRISSLLYFQAKNTYLIQYAEFLKVKRAFAEHVLYPYNKDPIMLYVCIDMSVTGVGAVAKTSAWKVADSSPTSVATTADTLEA